MKASSGLTGVCLICDTVMVIIVWLIETNVPSPATTTHCTMTVPCTTGGSTSKKENLCARRGRAWEGRSIDPRSRTQYINDLDIQICPNSHAAWTTFRLGRAWFKGSMQRGFPRHVVLAARRQDQAPSLIAMLRRTIPLSVLCLVRVRMGTLPPTSGGERYWYLWHGRLRVFEGSTNTVDTPKKA